MIINTYVCVYVCALEILWTWLCLTYWYIFVCVCVCVCECKLNVCMDDELSVELSAKLLAEVNGDVCLFYPFMKKGSVNDIRMLCMVYIRGRRRVWMVYIYLWLVPIRGGKRVWMVYTCAFTWYPFVWKGRRTVYTHVIVYHYMW